MDMIDPMNSGIENTVPDMMELLKPDLHPSDCPQGDTSLSLKVLVVLKGRPLSLQM